MQNIRIFKEIILFFLSENYIFGKFDAFCLRLTKIDGLLKTIDGLSSLQSIKIEVYLKVFSFFNTFVSFICFLFSLFYLIIAKKNFMFWTYLDLSCIINISENSQYDNSFV